MIKSDEIIKQAIKLKDDGDLLGAEQILRKALLSGIDQKNIYIGIAAICDTLGKTEKALEALKEASLKYPNESIVLANLGGVMVRMGTALESIPILEKAISISPESMVASSNLAIAYAEIRDWKRAKATAEIALSLNEDSLVMLQLVATVSIETGYYSRALAAYDRIAQIKKINYLKPSKYEYEHSNNSYSRLKPSPRYKELSEQYQKIHFQTKQKNKKTFSGLITFLRVAPYIRKKFKNKNIPSLLDYGGGQGKQYDLQKLRNWKGKEFEDMKSYLEVNDVKVYDAGRPETNKYLGEKYTAVICTDVLEHCDHQDLPWIIEELFQHSEKFLFATIATYPAVKKLPNGENAHCTIKEPEWWSGLFLNASRKFPKVEYSYLIVRDKGFEKIQAFSKNGSVE